MFPNFSLKQLSYLVSVADLGSMRAAAEAENVSQAAISMGLRDLEQRLGVQLLARRPGHGVSITQTGRGVAADARRVLAASGELLSAAEAPAEDLRGVLNVGCFTALTPSYVPPLIGDFGACHPAVQLQITEGNQNELRRGLEAGILDLAVTWEGGMGSGIATETVDTMIPYALLPADHELAQRPALALADLADVPLVQYAHGLTPEIRPSSAWETEHARAIVHTSPNIEVVRSLVARGVGWTPVFQQWLTNTSLEGLPLRSVPIVGQQPLQRVVVAWPERQPRSRRAIAALEFIRSVAVRLSRPPTPPQGVTGGSSPITSQATLPDLYTSP
jgi:DNA-binding transcriptional LysR family regulator